MSLQRNNSNKKERLLSVIRTDLTIASLLVLVISLISLLGFLSPSLDIYSHFRWQYTALLLLSLIAALLLRQRRLVYVLIAGCFLNAGFVAVLWLPDCSPPGSKQQALSILNMNLQYGNRDYTKVLREVRRVNPDVVSVEELTPSMLSALINGLPDYRYRCALPRTDAYGIGLLSRLPFNYISENPLKLPLSLVVQGDIKMAQKTVSIMAIHACGPTSTVGTNLDRAIAENIATWRRDNPSNSLILIGDLNSTPWSCIFQRILRAGNFKDSERGFGLQCSWPAMIPILSLPIDHCFYSKDWCCVSRKIEPSIGSDHFPLLVLLAQSEPHKKRID